ncbi:flavin reductase family protein [Roseovarius sp.]|uniref:flavin reductase family protein n=1 Tax=Roseovarius sp. TaxID=1486281 RepID=UPI0025E899CB|nr:flavin reductase family protein [Roseovarius sp.]
MSVEREVFLAAMRQVAATVTVVTTDGPAGRAGATVSAFTSLTADPPSVLVCLRSDSRIARAVIENRAFCVNVLPEDAIEVARAFAGSAPEAPADRFCGLSVKDSPQGPILARATAFSCALNDHMIHGSHAICIGSVLELTNAGEKPLTYLSGSYHIVRPHQD